MPVNDRNPLLHSLEQVFRECFFDDDLSIEEDMVSHDVDGWDSLSHVRLLMMIERRFGIELPVAETARLQNVGGLLGLVASKLSPTYGSASHAKCP